MTSAYIDVNLHINNALLIVVSSLIRHRHTYVQFNSVAMLYTYVALIGVLHGSKASQVQQDGVV